MTALVLTLVIALSWVGAIALGYWHGGWRQVVALAGILLSYAVLSEWAGPNGRDLAAQFGWPLARATTSVALLYLVAGAVILGYLGALLLSRPAPLSSLERGLGALVGVLDGGLLLALVLRVFRSYAFAPGEGQALRDSALARFLIEQVGYLLILAFVVGIGAVVAGAILSRRAAPAVAEPVPVTATITPVPDAGPALAAPPAPVPSYGEGYNLAASPAAADPYDTSLEIEWPSAPPPGMPASPTPAEIHPPEAPTESPVAPSPAQRAPATALPMDLRPPPRVTPPQWFPVETFMGGERRPAPPVAIAPRTPPPVTAADAETVVPQAAPVAPTAPPLAQPSRPPPGVPFVPPVPKEEPERPPSEEPIVVHELDTQTRDSAPAAEPDTTDETVVDVAAPPAPLATTAGTAEVAEDTVVSEADTVVPVPQGAEDARPMVFASDDATVREDTPVASPHDAATVTDRPATGGTAPIPPVAPVEPPPPPAPDALSQPQSRGTSYARVAQARQSERPAQPPAPQPGGRDEPVRPPLPTGPDVYGCPTCGYPVRRHTRYCPNCGTRLR